MVGLCRILPSILEKNYKEVNKNFFIIQKELNS